MNTVELQQHQHLQDDLTDVIHELTQPQQHHEPYTVWDHHRNRKQRTHTTWHPSLLDQLAAATDPNRCYAWSHNDFGGRQIPGSCPVARLSVVDLQQRIHSEASAWYHFQGTTAPDSIACAVSGLHAIAGHLDLADLADLLNHSRRWRAWCKLLTGWSTPPWSPRVPCPACGRQGHLRIWLDRSVAGCGHDDCRAWWDEHSIGILANYIRTHTDAQANNATHSYASRADALTC